jgi:hypothetical protein
MSWLPIARPAPRRYAAHGTLASLPLPSLRNRAAAAEQLPRKKGAVLNGRTQSVGTDLAELEFPLVDKHGCITVTSSFYSVPTWSGLPCHSTCSALRNLVWGSFCQVVIFHLPSCGGCARYSKWRRGKAGRRLSLFSRRSSLCSTRLGCVRTSASGSTIPTARRDAEAGSPSKTVTATPSITMSCLRRDQIRDLSPSSSLCGPSDRITSYPVGP